MAPRRILLTVEYAGGHYQGFQRQAGQPSVQSVLERALSAVLREGAQGTANPETWKLACAGRTDAGVHALGQLCSFVTHDPREARRLAPALNHFLPADVRVHGAREVPLTFDVRRASTGKWYQYLVQVGPHPSALLAPTSWHVRRPLALLAMQRAAQHLVGEQDFESFRSAHCEAAHARRCIFALRIAAEDLGAPGQLVRFDLYGNAFCRHMCRILVGTLVEVGLGLRAPEDMPGILEARQRARAGMTAPPQGLCLRQIYLAGELPLHLRDHGQRAPGPKGPATA